MSFIKLKKFNEIYLGDVFFDTLKNDYVEFVNWFNKKSDSLAYVAYNSTSNLEAFLYLKVEDEAITDINPPIQKQKILKIGTFKINAHGTRLGEKFIKLIVDYMLDNECYLSYVTIFPKHRGLISLVEKYGFMYHGTKTTPNGIENVYVKCLYRNCFRNNLELDYPLIDIRNKNKFILAIYPIYHTRLFPDSILRNEDGNLIQDISASNSIHKIYISYTPYHKLPKLQQKDILIMYRTAESGEKAYYTSLVSTVCIVEEVKIKSDFIDINDFIEYCNKFSIFTIQELEWLFNNKSSITAIKFTHNLSFKKRPNRATLLDNNIFNQDDYINCFPINDIKFKKILKLSETSGDIIID